MSNYTVQVLIPFALHVASNQLVAIDEVPSGKACGCICPECKTPLIARHFKDKDRISNFAHSARKDFTHTKQECSYSYLVSVRSMAKQIFSQLECVPFNLPAVELRLPQKKWLSFGEQIVRQLRFYIAQEASRLSICPQLLHIETTFAGTVVDVLQQRLNNRPLVIYFVYEHRDVPDELVDPDLNADVLKIDLRHATHLFSGHSATTFIHRLTDFLLNDLVSKSWVNHPSMLQLVEFLDMVDREEKQLEDAARDRAAQRAQQEAVQHRVSRNVMTIPIYSHPNSQMLPTPLHLPPLKIPSYPTEKTIQHQYRCRTCDATYYVWEQDLPVCPRCRINDAIRIKYV